MKTTSLAAEIFQNLGLTSKKLNKIISAESRANAGIVYLPCFTAELADDFTGTYFAFAKIRQSPSARK